MCRLPAEVQLARQLEELIVAGYSRRHKRAEGKLTFLVGRLEMEELPYLLQEMDLDLTNDNGVPHLGGSSIALNSFSTAVSRRPICP